MIPLGLMPSVSPTLLAFVICIATAALEGFLVGSGVRQRLAALQMPQYSPPIKRPRNFYMMRTPKPTNEANGSDFV